MFNSLKTQLKINLAIKEVHVTTNHAAHITDNAVNNLKVVGKCLKADAHQETNKFN